MPYLTSVPNMTVLSPSTHAELQTALRQALYDYDGPVAVRYPRGSERDVRGDTFDRSIAPLRNGSDITLVSYGILINEVMRAAALLDAQGVKAEVVKLNCLTDFDWQVLSRSVRKTGRLVVAEDCAESGCIGEKLIARLAQDGDLPSFVRLVNLKDRFIPEGKVDQLYQRYGIDGSAIAAAALEGFEVERQKKA